MIVGSESSREESKIGENAKRKEVESSRMSVECRRGQRFSKLVMCYQLFESVNPIRFSELPEPITQRRNQESS